MVKIKEKKDLNFIFNNIIISSTINYSGSLPLAQGIKFE